LATGGLAFLVLGCGRPPQLGADEEVFKTVDALFTAVTARDANLVARCDQRLKAFGAAQRMPADAARYLDGIVARTHQERWEPAAEQLYAFMIVQRRDGQRARR
jgi:hypothetical protein